MMLEDLNVRAPCYDILRAHVECPHCACATTVVALSLPAGHQTLELVDGLPEAGEGGVWQTATLPALLFNLEYLPSRVLERLRRFAPAFDLAALPSHEPASLGNHCERCRAFIADDVLLGEPGGAFLPVDAASAARIEAYTIVEALEAVAGGYAPEPFFFESVRRFTDRDPAG